MTDPRANTAPDFELQTDGGSLALLSPVTDAAREWVDEHVGPDNGYQPMYPTVLIEPRYLPHLIAGALRAGFKIGLAGGRTLVT